MSEKPIMVVGGGMAGLVVGCDTPMNSYRATVLEMHQIPGGLYPTWKRKGDTSLQRKE